MSGYELRRRLSQAFDLPQDVSLDLPRILLVGRLQLVVENHRGLIDYTPERITVGVPRGQLAVWGRDLVIGSISPEELSVTGQIDGVRFEG